MVFSPCNAVFDCAHRNTQCNGNFGVFHALMVAHVPCFKLIFAQSCFGKGYEPYKIAVEQWSRSVIIVYKIR